MNRFPPPLFVFEGLDLSIYDSLDSVEGALEGIDVEDGIFEVFDAMGSIVHLEATGVVRGKFSVEIGQTHVRSVDPRPTGAERLSILLANHLAAIHYPVPADATLNELVTACAAAYKLSP